MMHELIYQDLKVLYTSQTSEQYVFDYNHTRVNALFLAKKHDISLVNNKYFDHIDYMHRFIEETGMVPFVVVPLNKFNTRPTKTNIKNTVRPIKKFMLDHNFPRTPIMIVLETVYLDKTLATMVKLIT